MALTREQQETLHRAVLRHEPTAPARVAEAMLDDLVRALRARWPKTNEDELYEQAADSVMNYLKAPTRFDPRKSSLSTWLYLDADGDLRNAYDADKRRRARELRTGVALLEGTSEVRGDAYPSDDPESPVLLARLRELVGDDREWQVLVLMLEEVRDYDQYARVLGVEDLPLAARRREVKRVKDRITKRLIRGGVR